MGNSESNPLPREKTPFDILELEPGCSKEEIRKAYYTMLLRYHPQRNKDSSDQKVMEIKDAYQTIISGNYKPIYQFDLSKYTEEYFSRLTEGFFDACDGFIRLLLLEEPEVDYPSFKSINHKKFYDYFSKFKTQRNLSKDKIINKELVNDFNKQVREIISFIKKHDPRLKTEIKKEEIKKEEIRKKKEKIKIKKERITEYNCEDCGKGFKNGNQYINHVSSKKHSEKKGWTEEIREAEIKKIKKELKEKEEIEKKEEDEYEDEFDQKVKRNQKLLENLYFSKNKKKEENEEGEEIEEIKKEEIEEEIKNEKIEEIKKEKEKIKKKKKKEKEEKNDSPTKCSLCKIEFTSRNKLFIHLKEEHGHSKKKKKK